MANLHLLDVVQVRIVGRLYGQTTISTYGYVVTAITGTPDQLSVFGPWFAATQLAGGLLYTYLHAAPAAYDCRTMDFQVISPTRYAANRYTVAASGELDDTAQITQVSASVTRRGDLAEQSNVGHVNIPAPGGADWVMNGIFKPAYMTQLNLHAAAISEELTYATARFTPVLLKNNGTSGAPITQTFAQDTVRVVRRRTVGLGI